ncbi:hypothetical protein BX661DRAFT_187438 [Kickxella alabastrina]|uniref:uncharacterized protein n=1 Tax=Kickxella alabastrina TaxID=61397 RepID=UPI0022204E4E|nr:uncharacterized protein BX661DRAFT_187438 [Kickxella alabastrina]KAI7822463.1 hypothetical protein BX661DRAFT_187438 [Kickxella alabastrina]
MLKNKTKAAIESNFKSEYWNHDIASVCNFILIFLYRREFGERHLAFKRPGRLPIDPNATPKRKKIIFYHFLHIKAAITA